MFAFMDFFWHFFCALHCLLILVAPLFQFFRDLSTCTSPFVCITFRDPVELQTSSISPYAFLLTTRDCPLLPAFTSFHCLSHRIASPPPADLCCFNPLFTLWRIIPYLMESGTPSPRVPSGSGAFFPRYSLCRP